MEKELDEELQFHLEKEIEKNKTEGMSFDEARYQAMRDFGGVDRIKEQCRDTRGLRIFDELFNDLRYSLRTLFKNPGFTAVVIVTLGLGIGVNTAIFSIVNAVLLRPFPYHEPERLVTVGERPGGSVSYPNFVDWKDDRKVFDATSAVRSNENFNLTGTGAPERLSGRLVSGGFLTTLGVTPQLGRDFVADDDRPGAQPTVILSYGFWNRRFGGDANVIGRQITLNNQNFTIVGVTTPSFQYGMDADVTVPIGLTADRFSARGADPGTGVVARLRQGMSLQQAEAELNVVYARLEQQYPQINTGRRAVLNPVHESFVGDVRQALLILFGAVGLVLLIACANVANLLLIPGSTSSTLRKL